MSFKNCISFVKTNALPSLIANYSTVDSALKHVNILTVAIHYNR